MISLAKGEPLIIKKQFKVRKNIFKMLMLKQATEDITLSDLIAYSKILANSYDTTV